MEGVDVKVEVGGGMVRDGEAVFVTADGAPLEAAVWSEVGEVTSDGAATEEGCAGLEQEFMPSTRRIKSQGNAFLSMFIGC